MNEGTVEESDKGERKRQREKQRRSDFASAFEELQALLDVIEPDSDGYKVPSVDSDTTTPSTRLDLVRQTTETLRRIYYDNVEMRRLLNTRSTGTDTDNEVCC
jgi:hypothetical protein